MSNKWNVIKNDNDSIGNVAPSKKPEHIQLVENLGDDLEALRVEILQLTKAINEFSKVFEKPKAESQSQANVVLAEAQILDFPSAKRGRGRPKGSKDKEKRTRVKGLKYKHSAPSKSLVILRKAAA